VVAEKRPERILHLAAIARFADADANPMLAHETNVLGTMNVSAVAAKMHVPLVYSSTGSVYMPIKQKPPITEDFAACGNSVYGCTKYLGELYVKQVTPHIILRYAHLYGHEKRMHGLIGGFLARIERGLAPTLYGGKQSNDFTYIKDIAKANAMALEAPWDKWGQAYNIGTGEELSAEAAGRVICEAFGYEGERSTSRNSARWTLTASSSTARRLTGCSGSRRTTSSKKAWRT
jgi:nucleoside-diphosphate-sugar epimerase